MTTPASGLKASCAGGRPPVDTASPDGVEQPGREQGVDPGADGRAGQAGELDELGAGARRPVEHELEQLPGAGRRARGEGADGRHAG